eukprot:916288-Prymnesium_polylepis.1
MYGAHQSVRLSFAFTEEGCSAAVCGSGFSPLGSRMAYENCGPVTGPPVMYARCMAEAKIAQRSSGGGTGGEPNASRTPSEPPARRPSSSTRLACSPGRARPAMLSVSRSCLLRDPMATRVLLPRKRSRAKLNLASPTVASNWPYAASSARWSLWRYANLRFDSLASLRFSIGERNGDRLAKAAAIVSASSVASKHTPSRISLPRRASIGSFESSCPMGVSCSSESSAPRELSSATAAATASREGGSGSRPIESAARPGSRRLLVLITSCSRATRQTSGSVYGESSVSEVKRCMQRPCWTRPARPRRCLAAAAEMSTSWRDAIRRATS